MRALLLLFALAVPLAPLARAAENAEARIREAIALHDAGKYDAAIAIYKSVLADEPSNIEAAYELSLSLQGKGDHAQCREVAARYADQEGPMQPGFLTTLGSCLDIGGDHVQAIATFRKGLAIAPDDPMLLYNLAVTLWGQQQFAEARELLKKELALRPEHPTAHYVLGQIFQQENFRAPAILSYLRFLALEPSSPRSQDAAVRLVRLLGVGVVEQDRKNVTIIIDRATRKEEGDFSLWEMMLGLTAAASTRPENRRQTPFDRAREQLTRSLKLLVEASDRMGPSWSMQQNVPFFAELLERQLLDAYAGLALSSLNLKGGDRWLKKNDAAVQSFVAFMRGPAH